MEKLNQVEEVDIYGEDEEYFYSESMEEKIKHEIVKIGQPWNVAIDINDPEFDLKNRKHGEEARRLEELRESLSRMVK